jgi:hypothetical protein
MRFIVMTCLWAALVAPAMGQNFGLTKPALPDKATATNVGCAILRAHSPNWERENQNRGCDAERRGEVWVVYWRLPEDTIGGSPTVELSRFDARVLKIYMTQ